MERDFRPTIHKIWSRSMVFSVEDTLYMNKIKLSMSPIGKNKGTGTYVFGYLDIDDALLIADAVMQNKFSGIFPPGNFTDMSTDTVAGRYRKYGGSPSSSAYGGQPESRIIEIAGLVKKDDGTPRWMVTIKVGAGIKDPEKGTIKPKDPKMMASQNMFISNEDMRKLMIMLDLHIRTYFAKYFEDIYGPKGDYNNDFRDDCFKSNHRSPVDGVSRHEEPPAAAASEGQASSYFDDSEPADPTKSGVVNL